VKHWKKIYQANGPQKQAGEGILTSDKVEFRLRLIIGHKAGHSIIIKGELHKKEITIINLYASNVRTTNFIKHTLKDTVVVGDVNTPPITNR
jgi:hypothetical protein